MTPSSPSPYRPFFTPEECAMLDASSPDDLMSEINLLRILLTRVLDASRRSPTLSLKQHAAILGAFSACGIALAGLVRLQSKLHNKWDDFWAEIELGKSIGRQHLGVLDYFSPPAPA